jgi:hypothetical protein
MSRSLRLRRRAGKAEKAQQTPGEFIVILPLRSGILRLAGIVRLVLGKGGGRRQGGQRRCRDRNFRGTDELHAFLLFAHRPYLARRRW